VDADPFRAVGLPPGLHINARTGVIFGTIDSHAAGNYAVTVYASDDGETADARFVWRVVRRRHCK
jgi:hypothetical protein